MKHLMAIEDIETGEKNTLKWSDKPNVNVQWSLSKDTPELKKKLEEYFNTEKNYNLPLSDKLDDYEVVQKKPIEGYQFFEMSLSELFVTANIQLVKYLGKEK